MASGLRDSTKDIDYAGPDEFNHFNHHFSISMELDKHPFLSVIAFVAIALIVFDVLKRGVAQRMSTSSATTPNPVSPTIISVPTQSPTTNPAPPTTTTTKTIATIRGKSGIAYDQTAPGVPIRSQPGGGNVVRYAPFGSTIEISGSVFAGADNGVGNTSWYHTADGNVISAYDISTIAQVTT